MKNITKNSIRILALILLSAFACFAQSADQTSLSGKAVVYFYSLSTSTTLGQIRKPVFLDDLELADIRPERYFIVLVEPGKHSFHLKKKKFGGIEMNFETGKTYYLRIDWRTGGIVAPAGITLVEAESGGYDIRQLRPVDEKNIENKEIVFRELKP